MRKPALFPYIVLLISLLVLQQPAWAGNSWSKQYSKVSLFYLFNNWEEDVEGEADKLNEGVIGVRANHVVSPRYEFNLWGTFTAASHTDRADNDASLSSLNDTRLKGTFYPGNRTAAVSVLLNLPTGKKELSDDEYLISLGVADNSRKYAVRRFGQGLDVGGELLWLPKLQNTEFQVGGGYLYKGSYRVFADNPSEYKYGNELYGKAGFDVISRPVRIRGMVMFKAYASNELDSEPVYQAGNTLILAGRLNYAGNLRGSVGIRLVARSKAKITGGESDDLTDEPLKSGRDELHVHLSGSIPLGEQLRLLGRSEYNSVTANDYDRDSAGFRPSADYIGIGGGLGYQLTPAWSASAMATYYTGKADENNDLTGLGLAAILTFRYW